MLAEPVQRNTAAAIGLAAQILHSADPDAVMGVFPSDHVVSKPAVYRTVVEAALKGAAAGKLMVVGIQPRWPETGYGYIEFPVGAEAGTPGSRSRAPLPREARAGQGRGDTWRPATSIGTPACSSGARTYCSEQLRQHLPKTATLLAALPPFGDARFRGRALPAGVPAVREHLHRLSPCWKKAAERRCRHRRAPISAGTTSEVGTPSTSCCRATAGNVRRARSVCLDSLNNFVDARGKMVALLGVET